MALATQLVAKGCSSVKEGMYSALCDHVCPPYAFGINLDSLLSNALEAVQQSFLLISAGLGKHVRKACLLYGHMPIMHHWVQLSARVWNKSAVVMRRMAGLLFMHYEQTCS